MDSFNIIGLVFFPYQVMEIMWLFVLMALMGILLTHVHIGDVLLNFSGGINGVVANNWLCWSFPVSSDYNTGAVVSD